MIATFHTTCRACGGQLDPILSLGDLRLSTFLKPGDPPPPTVPLVFCSCRSCDLAQLDRTVDPDLLFRQYWYASGINEAMRAELKDVAVQAEQRVGGLSPKDAVLDIGANDGTLLACYAASGAARMAYEPATNLYEQLRPHCEVLVHGYFPGENALGSVKAKVITSIAMFYDLEDPKAFIEAISQHLHPRGVWIVQFQDLQSQLDATAVDNLVHEHLLYLSLRDMERLLDGYGLHVTDAELRPINGGSLRLYIQHRGTPVSPRVISIRAREANLTYDALVQFAWRCGELKKQLKGLLEYLHAKGQIVDVYGASTKFNTLDQFVGIAPLVRWAVERDPRKVGLTTVTGIPIVSEATWRADPGPVALLGVWQFKESILKREDAYLLGGGSFIVPCPSVEVLTGAVSPLLE
jgi:2-polyprenyl-3-methyl-5-hydroxy-6-metoxy-1,4-benzoquinol methylase